MSHRFSRRPVVVARFAVSAGLLWVVSRYVDAAASLELLCTKPGKGSLGANGTPLAVKGAKPLPSSD